jgi:hypothetical protein
MRCDIESLLRFKLAGHASRQNDAVADGFNLDVGARD